MDAPAEPVGSVDAYEDEEWELCNDDGFVYKRRKRRRVAGDDDGDATARMPDSEVDSAAEERNRRERKRIILLKLKSRYQKEIEQWEILSNSLSAMQDKANGFQMRQLEHLGNVEKSPSFRESYSGGGREQDGKDGWARPSLLDELILMAEAQEAMIGDVTRLCEVGEEMCRVEEEVRKEAYMNLPIWASPTHLMASLCFHHP